MFAVKTTGVFCKPSCAARTPRRENVEYFETVQAAVAAGYRACLRCRPSMNGPEPWVVHACRRLEAADEDVPLEELARTVGRSPSTVQRAFKAVVGVSPKVYAQAIRHRRLREALREPQSITSAAYAAGFASSARFYAQASSMLGMTPRRYQAMGNGETMEYTTAQWGTGRVLVARTARGVCAVLLGTDENWLVADLVRQFAGASVVSGGDDWEAQLSSVLATLDTGAPDPELPLDIRGTVFQHRVWQALRRISPGQTRTYAEVAAEIGAPRAVRAVGSACAANCLAVVVPCHRVLRSDGELGGFRWGLDVKRKLLDAEQQLTNHSK